MSGTRTSIISGLVSSLFLALAQTVSADPTWFVNGLALNLSANPADLVAAFDELNAAPVFKQSTGRSMLLVNLADGDNPATHTLVVLNKSAAAGEAFSQKLMADPAFLRYRGALAKLGTSGVLTARYRTIKSWGDISDSDVVWLGVFLAVKDEQKVLAARDHWGASEMGKKFPGQAHLSAVVAAGPSPATHVFTVGYASEAEMESWTAQSRVSAEWRAYQTELRANADVLGFTLSRVVKSWGPASMKDVSAPQ